MKRWGINFLFLLMAILSGVVMYLLKYHVIEREDQLILLQRQIMSDSREIHMLQGDWASLTDPERLRALVEKTTKFKAFGANQVIDVSSVPPRDADAGAAKAKGGK